MCVISSALDPLKTFIEACPCGSIHCLDLLPAIVPSETSIKTPCRSCSSALGFRVCRKVSGCDKMVFVLHFAIEFT
jgi:hypothetical protein